MVEQRNFFKKLIHPLYIIAAYLFLYIPIVVMVLFSFNDSDVSMAWKGFSWRWYKEVFYSPQILSALKVSLIVAAISTLISVTLGTLLVMASHWWHPFFLFRAFYSNVLLPDIVLSIGLMSMFAFLRLPLGYLSLITGHTLLGLGFVIPILRARFSEFDPILIEASLDLGGNYFQTCRRIILPLLTPALIAASLLVFTLSLDDFMISFFCSGAEIQTLSVYVYYNVKTLVHPSINAVSACLLAVSSFVVFLLCYFKVVDKAFFHD